jgi:hypothetical protein
MKTYGFKLALSVACIFFSIVVSAQGVVPNDKVKAAFPAEELAALTPERIDYLNFYSENAFTIHTTGKNSEGTPLLSTTANNGKSITAGAEGLNILLYSIQPLDFDSQFFIIDGTEQVLQVFSQTRIDTLYERFKINRAKLEKNKAK